MLVEPPEVKPCADYCVDNLADCIFPVAALLELLPHFFVIEPGVSHLTLKHIRREVAHGRLLQIQSIHYLVDGMEVTANQFPTGFQKAVHSVQQLE